MAHSGSSINGQSCAKVKELVQPLLDHASVAVDLNDSNDPNLSSVAAASTEFKSVSKSYLRSTRCLSVILIVDLIASCLVFFGGVLGFNISMFINAQDGWLRYSVSDLEVLNIVRVVFALLCCVAIGTYQQHVTGSLVCWWICFISLVLC